MECARSYCCPSMPSTSHLDNSSPQAVGSWKFPMLRPSRASVIHRIPYHPPVFQWRAQELGICDTIPLRAIWALHSKWEYSNHTMSENGTSILGEALQAGSWIGWKVGSVVASHCRGDHTDIDPSLGRWGGVNQPVVMAGTYSQAGMSGYRRIHRDMELSTCLVYPRLLILLQSALGM